MYIANSMKQAPGLHLNAMNSFLNADLSKMKYKLHMATCQNDVTVV